MGDLGGNAVAARKSSRVNLASDPRSFARRPADRSELLGQVLTPPPIADMMACELLCGRSMRGLRILDPAVGPGTFPAALVRTGKLRAADCVTAIDVDKVMLDHARQTFSTLRCRAEVIRRDYLLVSDLEPHDLAILNPPYIRQEWLDSKARYLSKFRTQYGLQVPGTSNLYVYFVVKALQDLRLGGRFVCLVYDSWQATRFGRWLVGVLERCCDELRTIAVPSQPFGGRLIDATIITGRRIAWVSRPTRSVLLPKKEGPLAGVQGLCEIQRLCATARGLRLKQSDFFLSESASAPKGATPFVKKLGGRREFVVPSDHPESALLIMPGDRLPTVEAELYRRLISARKAPADNVSVLTWYRERRQSWLFHRAAPQALFLFNYYLRHRPLHRLNDTNRIYSDNFYGVTPFSPINHAAALALLNSTAVCVDLLARSRNQGGGLAKLQLFEYRGARVPDWTAFSKKALARFAGFGLALMRSPEAAESTLLDIDRLVASELSDARLAPRTILELLREAHSLARRSRLSNHDVA